MMFAPKSSASEDQLPGPGLGVLKDCFSAASEVDRRLVSERIQWILAPGETIARPYLRLDKLELSCPDPQVSENIYYSAELKFVIPIPTKCRPIACSTEYVTAGGALHQDSNSVARGGDSVVVSSKDLTASLAQNLLERLQWFRSAESNEVDSRIDETLAYVRELGFKNIFPIPSTKVRDLYEPVANFQNVDGGPGLYFVRAPRAVSFLPGPVAIDQTLTAGPAADGGPNFLLQRQTVFIFKLTKDGRPSFIDGVPDVDTYDLHQFRLSYVDSLRRELGDRHPPPVVLTGALSGKDLLFFEAATMLSGLAIR